MENLNREIGERLRFIRSIFNEGSKLSANQFAHILNETLHKILNYETGRAQVPPSLLISLYRKGINPIFILTGEGSIFAPNTAGTELSKRFSEKINLKQTKEETSKFNFSELASSKVTPTTEDAGPIHKSLDELLELAHLYTAAAGNIMKIIQNKNKNE
ncbi:MAG: helix-turn-helix domain-containing protein [Ignavibacteria bacterium]|nr:helix-turn-helix domain-containing protein [Ignavibacteria bacterium]